MSNGTDVLWECKDCKRSFTVSIFDDEPERCPYCESGNIVNIDNIVDEMDYEFFEEEDEDFDGGDDDYVDD